MTDLQEAWSQWLAELDDEARVAAIALRDRFTEVHAEDPEEWAMSEISEDIPQMARYLFLRRLWADAVNSWEQPGAVESFPVAHRMLGTGAERPDLVGFARAVAVETISFVLYALDEGCDSVDTSHLPGWRLEETDATDGHALTGRHVAGLQESLLETDPSGEWGEGLGE
ncbi:hypothetical protein ACFCV9_05025 [Streptomyces sp. NPDC056367]|uniref:hypothetical protein n=1 Tax=Streptomyces sp. NPDC056367 TaxID=3345797 RepID=UPI0035D6AEB5